MESVDVVRIGFPADKDHPIACRAAFFRIICVEHDLADGRAG